MPRSKRIVVPGLPHHITQRGNGRANVFDCDQDRVVFLDLLASYSQQYGLSLWGYCLMSNHFHLVAVPAHEGNRQSVGEAGLRPFSQCSPPYIRTSLAGPVSFCGHGSAALLGGRLPMSSATLYVQVLPWQRPITVGPAPLPAWGA
jgi:hypothetical protein